MTTPIIKIQKSLYYFKQKLMLLNTDFVFASYPKTGVTWVQTLLRFVLMKHFLIDESLFNQVFVNTVRRIAHLPLDCPQIFVTHGMPWFNEERRPNLTLYNHCFKSKKIILMIREPKDTLVSLYFHNRDLSIPPVYTKDLDSMVYDEVYGIWKYIAFYRAWHLDKSLFEDFYLLRYENLKENTEYHLKKLCDFLGLKNITNDTIQSAIELSSFENMRKGEMENSKYYPELTRHSKALAKNFHTREGIIGGHKKYLSDKACQYVDNQTQQLAEIYGYPLP